MEPYTAEFTEKGELSEESIAKAATEFGVSQDMVRQYLAGAQATQAAQRSPPSTSRQAAPRTTRTSRQWSATGMTEAEQTELNEAYAAGNPEAALALQTDLRGSLEGGGQRAGSQRTSRGAPREASQVPMGTPTRAGLSSPPTWPSPKYDTRPGLPQEPSRTRLSALPWHLAAEHPPYPAEPGNPRP
jgi:hypothetical protein